MWTAPSIALPSVPGRGPLSFTLDVGGPIQLTCFSPAEAEVVLSARAVGTVTACFILPRWRRQAPSQLCKERVPPFFSAVVRGRGAGWQREPVAALNSILSAVCHGVTLCTSSHSTACM